MEKSKSDIKGRVKGNYFTVKANMLRSVATKAIMKGVSVLFKKEEYDPSQVLLESESEDGCVFYMHFEEVTAWITLRHI